MPTHIASIGGVTFLRPVNNTGNTNYFATDVTGLTPPTERLQRITYPGVDGQAVKKLGAGPHAGTLVGFIDAASLAHLETGRAAVAALAKAQTAGALSFYDASFAITSGIVTGVTFGRAWGYSGRYCLDFELAFESVG